MAVAGIFCTRQFVNDSAKFADPLFYILIPWKPAAEPNEVIEFGGGRAHDARQDRYPLELSMPVYREAVYPGIQLNP